MKLLFLFFCLFGIVIVTSGEIILRNGRYNDREIDHKYELTKAFNIELFFLHHDTDSYSNNGLNYFATLTKPLFAKFSRLRNDTLELWTLFSESSPGLNETELFSIRSRVAEHYKRAFDELKHEKQRLTQTIDTEYLKFYGLLAAAQKELNSDTSPPSPTKLVTQVRAMIDNQEIIRKHPTDSQAWNESNAELVNQFDKLKKALESYEIYHLSRKMHKRAVEPMIAELRKFNNSQLADQLESTLNLTIASNLKSAGLIPLNSSELVDRLLELEPRRIRQNRDLEHLVDTVNKTLTSIKAINVLTKELTVDFDSQIKYLTWEIEGYARDHFVYFSSLYQQLHTKFVRVRDDCLQQLRKATNLTGSELVAQQCQKDLDSLMIEKTTLLKKTITREHRKFFLLTVAVRKQVNDYPEDMADWPPSADELISNVTAIIAKEEKMKQANKEEAARMDAELDDHYQQMRNATRRYLIHAITYTRLEDEVERMIAVLRNSTDAQSIERADKLENAFELKKVTAFATAELVPINSVLLVEKFMELVKIRTQRVNEYHKLFEAEQNNEKAQKSV